MDGFDFLSTKACRSHPLHVRVCFRDNNVKIKPHFSSPPLAFYPFSCVKVASFLVAFGVSRCQDKKAHQNSSGTFACTVMASRQGITVASV